MRGVLYGERVLEEAPLGLADYEPEVEPEYVWEYDATIYNLPDDAVGFNTVYTSREACLRADERDRQAGYDIEGDCEPYCVPLGVALAKARADGVPFIILEDDDLHEVRRWWL